MDTHHGGNLRKEAIGLGKHPDQLLDFSANINPLEHPDYLKTLYEKAFKLIRNYPDPDSFEIIESISEEMDIPAEKIVVGNGGSELINTLGQVFRNDKVVIVQPNFSEYERTFLENKASITYLKGKESRNFKPEVSEILDGLPSDCKLLCLSSPNNPTGYIYSKNEIEVLLEFCDKQNTYLLLDEAFIDFVNNRGEVSAFGFLLNSPHLIVLRSLTKIFAIPGLRAGYMGIGDPNIKNRMKNLLPEWSVNCLVQMIAPKLISDHKYRQLSREKIEQLKDGLISSLNEVAQLKIFPSEANYLLCKIENSSENGYQLKNYLGKEDIIIKECSSYVGLNSSFFRIAVKSEKDNRLLVDRIRRFFDGNITIP